MNRLRLNAAFPARVLTLAVALTMALMGLAGCGGAAQPPSVVITSPVANSTVEANTPLTIQGVVSGENLPAANITRIEVVLDGLPLANAPVGEEARNAAQLPIVLEWTPTTAGAHFIQFNVYGPQDVLIAKSDAVVFRVNLAAPTATVPPPTPQPSPQPTEMLPPPTATPDAAAQPDASTITATTATPATGTALPDSALATPTLTVMAEIVNVREGPGTNYPAIGQLQNGQTAVVTGKSADGAWWQIAFQNGNGWVFGELVEANAAAQSVTVAQAPPAPTSPPAPAAPATPVAQATATPAGPVCDESSPYWRGSNPNYPFCATQDPVWGDPQGDWNVYDNGKDIPLSISWAMFGPNIAEVRIHFTQSNNACDFARPAQREVDQVVPAAGTYNFNVLDFPYGGTFWVYFTVRLTDGRVVQWGQKKLCIR